MNLSPSRILLTTGILLISVLLIMPRFVGSNLRTSTVDRLLVLLPPEYRQQVELVETGYEPGWFGSHAEYAVTWLPNGLEQPVMLDLAVDFYHGPLLLTAGVPRLALAHGIIVPEFDNQEITEALQTLPFELPRIDLELVIGLDQSLRLDLSISEFEATDEGARLALGSLNASLTTRRDLSAELRLTVGTSQAEAGSDMDFALQSLEFRSESAQVNDLLAPSESAIVVSGLSSAGSLPFSVSTISFDSSLDYSPDTNERIDLLQRLQIDDIDSQLPLDSLDWTLEIGDVSANLARTYLSMLASLQEEFQSGGAGSLATSVPGEQVALLLQNSLTVDNTMNARAYDGEHSLNMFARWAGLPAATDISALSSDELISALELRVKMELDAGAVQRSPLAPSVDTYLQQEIIQVDGDRILLEFSLADSELVLNGKITSLEDLL